MMVKLRVYHSGSERRCQRWYEGSIPFTRSKIVLDFLDPICYTYSITLRRV